ncbi:transcriptional regulator family: Fungal Specific TF [Penicillium riverlandense]|uniref:transcriptional regulator family: Fungal Specific TF n=1 Tax=Penicillium riverlandense TaxID=1903569 RepID=UPI002546C7DF|nr:transcriptional regulator family: Fungal Specific TF [Penicillium riverlandense]KAJ5833000.1 transcriptional regulator family: Fungal Specific TF [Penicillium riverlandense]
MPRERFSRSRSGCLECRKKHQKCDEQQPLCSFCVDRGLNCKYPSDFKWIRQTEPCLSRHKPRCRRDQPPAERIKRSPAFGDVGFGSTEEKVAWEYYVRLVSSNVPALDGPDNPYRQVSVAALSSPILLETIVCIATEHMLNFGLSSVPVAAERQQRMLRTIGHNLAVINTETRRSLQSTEVQRHQDHEALLTAVVLQGIVVAQTADGVLEPHIKCALFLMQTLNRFHQIPESPLARMTAQRFAMVDVMLAISRQRRPYAPRDFVLHQPDGPRWDLTEPSFHKMTGCPQPLMCFLVRVSHLACDVDEGLEQGASMDSILGEAFCLENELRAWGLRYTGMITDGSPPLDILTECFYWTAHLLLARRVFRDATCSARVQHLSHTCFRLMDHLYTGCGPDSSLPQPFYLAAREAVTPTDRDWVRRKHEEMTAYYREQQRNLAMSLTEQIWQQTDTSATPEGAIKALDRESCLFIF